MHGKPGRLAVTKLEHDFQSEFHRQHVPPPHSTKLRKLEASAHTQVKGRLPHC